MNKNSNYRRIISNIKLVTFTLLVSAFAMSCSNEEAEEMEISKVPMQFTAVHEGFETADAAAKGTRTALQADGLSLEWVANDGIAVFPEGKFTNPDLFVTKAGGERATFIGSTTPSATYRALYPYDKDVTFDGESFHTTLSDLQTISDNNIGVNAGVMVATLAQAKPLMAGNRLTFKNACGVLKVTFRYADDVKENTGDRVTSINVLSRDKAPISGKVKIGADGNCVIEEKTTSGRGDIYAEKENGEELTEGASYYLMMPAQTINGIIVRLDNGHSHYSVTVKEPIDFTRNKIQSLNIVVKKWVKNK